MWPEKRCKLILNQFILHFAFGLILMTITIDLHKTTNILYDFDSSSGASITNITRTSCENLCTIIENNSNIEQCEKVGISMENLFLWTYINWILFACSIFQSIWYIYFGTKFIKRIMENDEFYYGGDYIIVSYLKPEENVFSEKRIVLFEKCALWGYDQIGPFQIPYEIFHNFGLHHYAVKVSIGNGKGKAARGYFFSRQE